MGEPRARRAKGEERIVEVLVSAEELLSRRGPEGVSLRAVADHVGISVGNLQYYFATRAALLDAVFERHAEIFRGELAALPVDVDDPRERLATLVDYWLGALHERGQSLWWHLWAISPHDDSARSIMDRVYGEMLTRMVGLLCEIRPTLNPAQATRRAATIVSLVEGSGLFVGYGRSARRGLGSFPADIRAEAMAIADRPA